MENQDLAIKKYAQQYGIILGGISVAFGLMLFFLDIHWKRETSISIVNLVISLSVIGFAQYTYRKDNEGFMSLGQGIKLGLGVTAVNAIIGVVYFLLLSNALDPEMMNKVLEASMNQYLEENPTATPEMINQVESMQENFSGPIISSAFIIVFSLFFGLIISLVTGLFLKRDRPE